MRHLILATVLISTAFHIFAAGESEASAVVRENAVIQPDVISGITSGMDRAQYERLSKIAPVIAQSADYPESTESFLLPEREMETLYDFGFVI